VLFIETESGPFRFEPRPCEQPLHALRLLRIWGKSGGLSGVKLSTRLSEPLLSHPVSIEPDVPNQ
jgi:hypothetical protein